MHHGFEGLGEVDSAPLDEVSTSKLHVGFQVFDLAICLANLARIKLKEPGREATLLADLDERLDEVREHALLPVFSLVVPRFILPLEKRDGVHHRVLHVRDLLGRLRHDRRAFLAQALGFVAGSALVRSESEIAAIEPIGTSVAGEVGAHGLVRAEPLLLLSLRYQDHERHKVVRVHLLDGSNLLRREELLKRRAGQSTVLLPLQGRQLLLRFIEVRGHGPDLFVRSRDASADLFGDCLQLDVGTYAELGKVPLEALHELLHGHGIHRERISVGPGGFLVLLLDLRHHALDLAVRPKQRVAEAHERVKGTDGQTRHGHGEHGGEVFAAGGHVQTRLLQSLRRLFGAIWQCDQPVVHGEAQQKLKSARP
mmetsp:Transcript_11331/g.42310  ORF Transcript_11331/g.42310 Transcript_11331/m.42310 type:complete len:368 (-) Transcript_11331:124-1227(-)